MTVTLADVARKAGVSTAAASNALRKTAREAGVRESTRTRILEAARQLGYRPNPFAASLRTRRTRTIGLFLPDDARSFFFHPNNAAQFADWTRLIGSQGYRITLLSHDWTVPPDARLMDGCLFMGWIPLPQVAAVERLARQIPVVSASRPIDHAITIRQDETAARRSAAGVAADYLYTLGHRRIAIVDVRHADRIDTGRLDAFTDQARRRGLTVQLSLFGDRWEERRYLSIPEILALSPAPTVILALDDDYARVLIASFAQSGRRVPRDVSVFSGHTTHSGFQSVPTLTGLAFDYEPPRRLLIQRFLDIVEGRGNRTPIALPPPRIDLIERDSCRPLKGTS